MRAPLPPEIALSIRLPTWHALFAARGYPPGVAPSTTSLDAIATALRAADLPTPLARALFTICSFATEAGRADLYAAADALGRPASPAGRWPDATSPADLIASLLAAAAHDDAAEELLEAAQILRDRAFRPRATHVYVGAAGGDPHVGEPTQYASAIADALASWLQAHDFGAILSVEARSPCAYTIVHEDRTSTTLTRDAPPTRQRPLRSHEVTYDPAARRLTITTDCMEAVTPLARAFGQVLFANPQHFLQERAVDLWKLQELGPAALTIPSLGGKLAMSAVGGTWHSGKNHAITPRGQDFFKALARYKIRIEGGRLDLVTLRATIADPKGGPRQCDVAVRPPHQLTVSEPELAPLLHDALDRAKITSPDPRPTDFFALQPWLESRAGWIASEGEAGFDALVAAGLLVADDTNRAVAPPDHPHAGRTATAYPLRGSRYLAWSPDPTVAPFVVDAKDLVVFALSFAKLAKTIAEALGLEGAAADLDDDGVLYCGRRALGPTHALVFLLTRPIRPATIERLRDAAEHGHAVLIAPEGRVPPHGLRQLAMPKLAGPWRPLLAALVRALHVEAFVETTLYAPEDARIVVHRATARVWVDGVACVAATELHVRLLDLLIRHAGQLVHTKDIADYVAQGRPTEDTTRRALESFVAAVEKSFKAAKKKAPKDLARFVTQPRHGRYTLHVKGFVE